MILLFFGADGAVSYQLALMTTRTMARNPQPENDPLAQRHRNHFVEKLGHRPLHDYYLRRCRCYGGYRRGSGTQFKLRANGKSACEIIGRMLPSGANTTVQMRGRL